MEIGLADFGLFLEKVASLTFLRLYGSLFSLSLSAQSVIQSLRRFFCCFYVHYIVYTVVCVASKLLRLNKKILTSLLLPSS